MKIAMLGYSGSGKSTTAGLLGEIYNIPVMYMDTVYWDSNWQVRDKTQALNIVKSFMEDNDSWIIDGNYKRMYQKERLESADIIVFFSFNRFNCLWRVVKRYVKYKGKSRPSITEGCDEKLDFEFIRWVLWDGRSKEKRTDYYNMCKTYRNKVVVLKNQRQLDEFIKNQKILAKN